MGATPSSPRAGERGPPGPAGERGPPGVNGVVAPDPNWKCRRDESSAFEALVCVSDLAGISDVASDVTFAPADETLQCVPMPRADPAHECAAMLHGIPRTHVCAHDIAIPLAAAQQVVTGMQDMCTEAMHGACHVDQILADRGKTLRWGSRSSAVNGVSAPTGTYRLRTTLGQVECCVAVDDHVICTTDTQLVSDPFEVTSGSSISLTARVRPV